MWILLRVFSLVSPKAPVTSMSIYPEAAALKLLTVQMTVQSGDTGCASKTFPTPLHRLHEPEMLTLDRKGSSIHATCAKF